MATTYTYKNGTGNHTTTYSFTFPYIKEADVKVEVLESGAWVTKTKDTHYEFTNATTLKFKDGHAPADVDNNIKLSRATDADKLTATFYPGSAIRSVDLNDNFTQNLYSTEESKETGDDAQLATDRLVAVTYNGGDTWTQTGNNTHDSTDPKGVGWAITQAEAAVQTADDAEDVADDAKLATDTYVHDGTNLKGGGPPDNEPKGVKWAVDQSEDAVATANLALPTGGGTMTGNIVLVAGDITANDIGNNQIDSQHYATGSIDNEHLAVNSVNSDQYVNLSIKDEHIDNGTLTSAKLSAATVVTNSEQAVNGYTANDTSFFTTSAADSRYFNVDDGETVTSSTAFGDSDSAIATTKAINDRIIELVDDVGGFWPIASENHFPNANPDINDDAGTIVSIKALSENIVTGSGVTSNNTIAQTIGGTAVNITGLTESTTYAAGFGMLVETTSTLNTYAFHRLVPKATEVTTVAGNTTNIDTVADNNSNITAVADNSTNINAVAGNNSDITTVAGKISDVETVSDNITDVSNFADLYQIATSAPSTDGGGNTLAAGDLWFDSSSNKAMKVHTGTTFSAVSPSQSVLNDISIVSGDLLWYNDLGNITDAIDTGTGTGSLDTCATNITNINTFSNVYRISASEPSTSKDPGDLWYDTANSELKVYNGTSFNATAVEGMDELVDDDSPTLGGTLDCAEQVISNIKLDFGTLT